MSVLVVVDWAGHDFINIEATEISGIERVAVSLFAEGFNFGLLTAHLFRERSRL